MDYRRTYWLLFLGIGLLFGLQAVLAVAANGSLDLTSGVSVIAAVVITGVAALALREPDSAGGPDAPGFLFFVAAGAFLLLLVGTAVQLLALFG